MSMLQSRKVTLDDTIILNSSRSGSLDIPLNGIISSIRARITGTYTGSDNDLDAEFPFNIFRNLQVGTSKGYIPYSLSSKDCRIMNFLDKKGKVKTSAASGAFEMNLVLDRGELLAFKADSLPKAIDHPALPFGSMTLAVTWAQDVDCGANIALTAATCQVELEETPATAEQLQRIYGEKLERWQAVQVVVQGDQDVTQNTAPTKTLKPTTGGLKRRIIIVTSNTSSVRVNTTVTKFQLKNKQVGQLEMPIDRVFLTAQNEDLEQYELSTGLTGVASIDILREITNDRYGMRSYNFDEKLELHTQNGANGKVRIIEENRIVNVAAFEAAALAGLV